MRPGGHRAEQDQIISINPRMLDHQHCVGPAREHPAGGDRRGRARHDGPAWHDARGQFLGVEPQPPRSLLGGAIGFLGPQGVAVDVRAVEGRHVDVGRHVVGQHPPQGRRQRHDLWTQRLGMDRVPPPPFGGVAVHHVEELVLLVRHRGLPSSGQKSYSQTVTVAPAG